MDIAVVGTGVDVTVDAAGICTGVRVVLGAVAPTAVVVDDAADVTIGRTLDAVVPPTLGRTLAELRNLRATRALAAPVAADAATPQPEPAPEPTTAPEAAPSPAPGDDGTP